MAERFRDIRDIRTARVFVRITTEVHRRLDADARLECDGAKLVIFHRSAEAWERADAGRSGLCLEGVAQSNARESRGRRGSTRRRGLSAIRIATFAGAYARVRSSRPWPTRIFLFDVLFQIGPRARSGRRRAGRRRGMETNPTTGIQVPGEMSGAGKVSEARRPRRRGRRSRAWTAPWRNKTRS